MQVRGGRCGDDRRCTRTIDKDWTRDKLALRYPGRLAVRVLKLSFKHACTGSALGLSFFKAVAIGCILSLLPEPVKMSARTSRP